MAGLIFIDSPLGKIRIEDDGEFVTVIHFEEGEPGPSESRPSPLSQQAAAELTGYFAGQLTNFTFPFRQNGTEFQQRVWGQLLLVPCGKTMSYHELALALNDEKCIRAAASANGKNKLAVVVPCHRIIGSNGTLVGYAGGLWRKQWLLDHESKMAGKPVQGALF